MNEQIKQALRQDKTIDITTIGRKSGLARRIEIWFHNLEGVIYITGRPGKRSWYANMLANPQFTFHLKGSVAADLPATAFPVTDPGERIQILAAITGNMAFSTDLDEWAENSPLVEVTFR